MNRSNHVRFAFLAPILLTIIVMSACSKSASPTTPTQPDSTSTSGNSNPPPPAKKWTVTTLAGATGGGFEDGDTTQAKFSTVQGIGIDNQGNLYVGDVGNASIRKITPTGTVSTFANDAISNPALLFGNIAGIALDQQGNVYDIEYNIIRKTASPTNTITFAGQLLEGYKDGLGTLADFNVIFNLAIDPSGNLYVPDYDTSNAYHLREISPAGQVTTLTLNDNTGVTGNGLPGYYYLYAVAVNPLGGLYVTSNGNNMIKKIDAQGNVTVFAGWTIGFTDGPGNTALFGTITGMACDSAGNLYVADATNNAIRKVTPAGVVSTIAGNGTAGYIDGDSTKAEFNNPFGIAVDKHGAVYVTDELNFKVRKLVFQ